ncbi:dimethylallyltranstransferase [Saccharothrix sp. ALI-22-I]|uniref:family 2 encapsulin nanocompartment cargo protein polyprenyl transferase n=1 Tax=Saccharothrix sp. ALI-22-I TaxID=1933778 RepID=UPI00097C2184|nr:family 2 encapsulin nanocompartment cargo protein polyprenyl transferase [Saccharothrix sp. ALI-22-I]ONI90862.1 dimethylallyltranstransferase [Saccharothrix sp. ALI-22-I]
MTGIDVPTTRRTAGEVLAWSRVAITPVLHEAVDTLPASTRLVVGYHFGWWDAAGRTARGGSGKAIRPAFTLLAAEAVGGDAAQAVTAAAAVELAHNHSLVHDDVMDRDATRRHRPTAWTVFGVNNAIQAGDALLALAFDVLAGSGHPAATRGSRMLTAAVLALVDGQAADMAFEQRTDVDVAECVRMSTTKTGALMACACALGAAFGGGRPAQVKHLRAFGEDVGVAFQHVDDLLGIWGDPAVTGKPIHSDLRNRKKSLPVLAAMRSGTPAGRELAALYHRDDDLSAAELRHVADLVTDAGGRAWSQGQVDTLLARARYHLRAAGLVARAADELFALAELATHRDH